MHKNSFSVMFVNEVVYEIETLANVNLHCLLPQVLTCLACYYKTEKSNMSLESPKGTQKSDCLRHVALLFFYQFVSLGPVVQN